MELARPNISCVSLGMVIIDEIRMSTGDPLIDVIGGSASFVTLGNRLFATDPAIVGCLVIAGEDFPETIEAQLEKWGTTLLVKRRIRAPSTRGLLVYNDSTFGPKTFEYVHPPLKAFPADLIGTPLLHATAFHFFATPEEIMTLKPELIRLRREQGANETPLLIWEPFPAACVPENYQCFLEACKMVDVFSPNHTEILSLFGHDPTEEFSPEKLQSCGRKLLNSLGAPRKKGVIVIRAGEHGSLTMSHTSSADWTPPFYEKGCSKVVDPTGAGNAFLGGYVAGWLATHDVLDATYHGHIAASFALEQIGLPKCQRKDRTELWNGAIVLDRLQEYRARLRKGELMYESSLLTNI